MFVWFVAAGCGNLVSCGNKQAGSQVASPQSGMEEDAGAQRGSNGKRKSRKASRRSRRAAFNLNTSHSWRALAFFVPDSIDGYRARTATEGHDLVAAPQAGVLSVKRSYSGKDDVVADLELLDTAHGARVRNVFNRAREVQRENDKVVIRPMKIEGHKALAQWFDTTHVARISVLVDDRFLFNANVKPADSPAPAIALAQKLDWDRLAALASDPPVELDAPFSDDVPDEPDVPISSTPSADDSPPPSGDAPESPDSSLLASQPQ